ncbi:FxsB family cyclophane-forming radical SAM/SPASM peptide maturase [Jidongwangia harbinensis]|uniref:FxsB family cyclophane-forming radical SAM/SPASM peptide maturase n=1 Tax=Jidongwangia harbinensis TaxID=2878561 RepID=UPI001CDA2A7C|nr:FxsB family cyclophane-forming radical SAM/SPASM peptide maturase [Jidongwangia harbinensis]MCA2218141.1 FxsB family radical SAM/SPASM domain protein [Jidongwangia harbinensis]
MRTLTPHPRWPHEALNVTELHEKGWRPTAFREFVLKVHQRCNLACDYCYVYELADQTWRDRPRVMAPAVWQAAANRIAEHARRHHLRRVTVILHGGEPLLAGPDRLLRLTADLRAAMPDGCRLSVGMQTNGVALDERTLTRLADDGITIGVSVDGSPADHDRHRTFANGTGSHAAVDRALRLLGSPPFQPSFAGLLSLVDPSTDPVPTFEALLRYQPPAVDLLLPHANWATPPDRRPGSATPHGDWLVAVFDRWYDAPRRETRIRLFEEVMSLLLGGSSRSEQVGLSPVAVAVVESDGAIEQVDSLKSAYPGACATGRNVRTDSFDAVLRHPAVAARQIGAEALCDGCRSCPVSAVCGAGHYAHRYRPGDGFRNPSVYCADLQVLIRHVHRRMTADLSRLAGR